MYDRQVSGAKGTVAHPGSVGGALAYTLAYQISTTLQPDKASLIIYGPDPFTANFLWVVILSTSFGISLSFTRLRRLEKLGTTDIEFGRYYALVSGSRHLDADSHNW